MDWVLSARDPKAAESHFRTCYAEFYGTRFWLTQRVLWRDDWKLVFNGFDYDELYDLKNDPTEQCDVFEERKSQPEIVELTRKVKSKGLKILSWKKDIKLDPKSLEMLFSVAILPPFFTILLV